jgi:hypothetical protein
MVYGQTREEEVLAEAPRKVVPSLTFDEESHSPARLFSTVRKP